MLKDQRTGRQCGIEALYKAGLHKHIGHCTLVHC